MGLWFYLSSSCLPANGAKPDQIRAKWRGLALLHGRAHTTSTQASHNLGSSTSSNTGQSTWRLPQQFIIHKYEFWGPRGNHNGGWQEEIANCWGVERRGTPLPLWPAGPAEPHSPSRHQGARARQASRMSARPQHPGVLSPDQPSPCWVTCLLSPLNWCRTQPCSSS